MSWQGVVNAVLYSAQFEKELNNSVVDRIAYALLTEPLGTFTQEEEYRILTEGLAARAPIPEVVSMGRSSAELRDFLSRIVARMDAMRPWPSLPYHRLSADSVSAFKNAVPIARISTSVNDIEARISRGFYRGTDFGTFIPLKMKSGRMIGMFTPFWDYSDDIVLVVATDEPEPSQAINELLSATRLDPAKVVPLTAEDLEPFTERVRTRFGGSQIPVPARLDHVVHTLERARELLAKVFGPSREFRVIETEHGWVGRGTLTAEEASQGKGLGQGSYVLNKHTGVITAHRSLPPEVIGREFDQAIESGRPVQGTRVYPPLHRIRLLKTSEDARTVRYQVHVTELEQPHKPPATALVTIDKETLHFKPSGGPLSHATAWAEMLSRTTGSWPTDETIDR